MLRIACLIFACVLALLPAPPAAAQSGPRGAEALALAMEAVRDGDWLRANRAAALAGQGAVGIATDIVDWHRLRRGDSSAGFGDYRSFLARNPDWPGLSYLRRQGEGAIPVDGNPDEIIAYFGDLVPATGHGALRLVQAYRAKQRVGDAQALAVLIWRSLPLQAGDRAKLMGLYGALLADHHVGRLDAMLWQGEAENARAMLPLVPEGWQKLAQARLALRAGAAGVDARIEAVPAALQDDPGLAYERFRWRAEKRRQADAIALMLARSGSAAALGRPALWAERRRYYARDVMREGQFDLAYRIAAPHHLQAGSDFADLEWLSGYLALRLGRPGDAVQHFTRFAAAVDTPISLGRAGYWLGRAHAQAGDAQAARAAWQDGARYQTSFYGLLSAEALGLPLDPALRGGEVFAPLQEASFAGSTVLAAGLMLYEAGEAVLAERFLTHLAEDRTRTEAGQIAALALSLKDPHLALRIAKRAAQDGHVLPDAYYPLAEGFGAGLAVAPELALSIARRESEFDPRVTSPAGARGLMQVMPGTARSVAADLGIAYRAGALLSDPAYNLRLGAAYLAYLADRFDGNPVLMSVGYNAGPHRADAWIARFGDPRDPGVDVIDWIEMIPFRETRNYAMRVPESLPAYAARLGIAPDVPLQFTAFLKGRRAAFSSVPATE